MDKPKDTSNSLATPNHQTATASKHTTNEQLLPTKSTKEAPQLAPAFDAGLFTTATKKKKKKRNKKHDRLQHDPVNTVDECLQRGNKKDEATLQLAPAGNAKSRHRGSTKKKKRNKKKDRLQYAPTAERELQLGNKNDALQLAPVEDGSRGRDRTTHEIDLEGHDETVAFTEDMRIDTRHSGLLEPEEVVGGETNVGMMVGNDTVDEEAPAYSETFEAYVPAQRHQRARQVTRARHLENYFLLVEGGNVKVETEKSNDKRCHLYIFVALVFVVIGIAVGVSVGLAQSNTPPPARGQEPSAAPSTVPSMPPSSFPTSSPTNNPSSTSFQLIVNELALDFDPITMLALQNFSSPQSRAARWIVDEDEIFTFPLDESDPRSHLRRRFRQRYALATFYYSTGGDVSWKRQGAFLSPSLDECAWGASAGSSEVYLTCSTECQIRTWQNLSGTCDDQLLVPNILILRNNNLEGSIPPEIGALTGMGGLDLSLNRLAGSLPKEIYDLRYLAHLSMQVNQLTGTLSGAGTANWANM